MAIADELAALNTNLADLKTFVDAAVVALGNTAPAGTEQALVDANASITGASAALKAATPAA